jgi:hypothetical protein
MTNNVNRKSLQPLFPSVKIRLIISGQINVTDLSTVNCLGDLRPKSGIVLNGGFPSDASRRRIEDIRPPKMNPERFLKIHLLPKPFDLSPQMESGHQRTQNLTPSAHYFLV